MNRLGSLLIFYFLIPHITHAAIEITEIMYDLSGTDSKREWVELFNSGNETVDLSDWRFHDGSNHKLNVPPENGGQGSIFFEPNTYLVLTSNASMFLAEHTLSNSVVDTVMSLNNTTDTLTLFDENSIVEFGVTYDNTQGAKGDGNSLQVVGGVWKPGTPSPGMLNNHNAIAVEDDTVEETNASNVEQELIYEEDESVIFDPYVSPDIVAIAGLDQSGLSGERLVFEGQALGSKNLPLLNARFLWNIGNGEVLEGQKVSYTFTYPGRHSVVLTIASGKKTVSDRLFVTIDQANVELRKFDRFGITLVNAEEKSIDISSWLLESGDTIFEIPENTFLLPQQETFLSSEVTKLSSETQSDVRLLLPNGLEVAKMQYAVESTEIVATSSIETQTQVTEEIIVAIKEPDIILVKKQVPEVPKFIERVEIQNEDVVDEVALEQIAVDQATSSETAIALSAQSSANGLTKWLLALLGLIGLASFAVISHLSKDEDETITADDIKIN